MTITRLLAAAVFIIQSLGTAHSDRPNIVVILADDYGVGDIQAHYPDNTVPSPHLDQLVRQGISFTDAHSPSAVCTPTRYGILTGRYSWRTRLQEWVIAAYEAPLIVADRPTLPGFLNDNDYHTACIGKWHLGWNWPGEQASRFDNVRHALKNATWDFEQPITGGPVDRGFDYYFGVDLPNMPPFTFIENDRIVDQPTETYRHDPKEGTVMPRVFDGCPIAPGWKFDEILPTLTQNAVDYIHERADKDEPFFLYFSQTSPHEPVVPSKDFAGKSGISPIADFLIETDWSAGQVIQAVDDAGIADDTIIIFTADNGHSHYTGWDTLIQAGHQPSGPYRGHKGDVWEGGHRVPLVIRWPGKIQPDTKSDQMICLTDLFATLADAIEVPLPDTGAEDSLSFLPSMRNSGTESGRTSLVNHSNFGEFAYREGPWKLVYKLGAKRLEPSRGKETIAELYRLDQDIDESTDLAASHPEILKRLTENLESLIESGASRDVKNARNDCRIDFRTTQRVRWAEPTDH